LKNKITLGGIILSLEKCRSNIFNSIFFNEIFLYFLHVTDYFIMVRKASAKKTKTPSPKKSGSPIMVSRAGKRYSKTSKGNTRTVYRVVGHAHMITKKYGPKDVKVSQIVSFAQAQAFALKLGQVIKTCRASARKSPKVRRVPCARLAGAVATAEGRLSACRAKKGKSP
jgi:hypothetical protein